MQRNGTVSCQQNRQMMCLKDFSKNTFLKMYQNFTT